MNEYGVKICQFSHEISDIREGSLASFAVVVGNCCFSELGGRKWSSSSPPPTLAWPQVGRYVEQSNSATYYRTLGLTQAFWSIKYPELKVKSTLWYPQFSPRTNEKNQLYYYDTSGRLVFVHFMGETEDTKKTNIFAIF